MVVAAICAIYVVLGTAMEELSMVLLTMPVFFPVIVRLGFDPVWFGIIIVCVVEIGLISPPVGMNMFVLKTLLPEVRTATVFRGVLPFMGADVVRLAILCPFPWLSLWLPSLASISAGSGRRRDGELDVGRGGEAASAAPSASSANSSAGTPRTGK